MRTNLFIANLALLFFIEPVAALDAQTLFSQQCSQCHGATLGGSAHGTALKGQIFKDTWAIQNWQALASLSSTTMPPGEPDRLSTAEHAAVARFIFTSNGLPVDAEDQQGESQETTGSDSWHGAAGVAEIARSRSNFKNSVVKGFKPVTQAELNNPGADDWLSWRRTLDGQAESPLKQVNKGNVKNLGLAWALAMQEGSAQITPIVRGGVMFLVQPGLVVQALKADTGDLIWQYKYPFPAASQTLGGPMRLDQ